MFEFFVRYPYGLSAVSGYRRAARHFGLHTCEDPSTVKTDGWRLLICKDRRKLRAAAKVLSNAYSSDADDVIGDAEIWLAIDSGVHWFHHDCKYWDQEQDRGALEQLGWERTIIEHGQGYRVTLRRQRRRR